MPPRRIVAIIAAALAFGMSDTLSADAAQWSIVPSPNHAGASSDALSGVSCISSSFCMTVGGGSSASRGKPLIEKWNGSNLTTLSAPVPSGAPESWLSGVACISTHFCMAVGRAYPGGDGAVSLIEQWNGSKWSLSKQAPNQGGYWLLTGVSCKSTSFCMAVGSYTLNGDPNGYSFAERWNGLEWASEYLPGNYGDELYGVSCPTAGSCMAVGDGLAGTLIEQWNGASWAISSFSTPGTLLGVRCRATNFCWAVGETPGEATDTEQPLAVTWNGAAWSIVGTADPGSYGRLEGVTCVSTTECIAAGSDSVGTLIEQWSGSGGWAAMPSASSSSANLLYSVSCAVTGTAMFCIATGTTGSTTGSKTLAEKY